MTYTNSSDLEEEREIQPAQLVTTKIIMYNAAVFPPYSMQLNSRQEADKSTITPSTKFSAYPPNPGQNGGAGFFLFPQTLII